MEAAAGTRCCERAARRRGLRQLWAGVSGRRARRTRSSGCPSMSSGLSPVAPPNWLGHVGQHQAAVGLPDPVRGGLGDVAKARLALPHDGGRAADAAQHDLGKQGEHHQRAQQRRDQPSQLGATRGARAARRSARRAPPSGPSRRAAASPSLTAGTGRSEGSWLKPKSVRTPAEEVRRRAVWRTPAWLAARRQLQSKPGCGTIGLAAATSKPALAGQDTR